MATETRRDAPPAVHRPSRADLAFIAVAVCGVSTSGPLIRATAVSAVAIGFWRNAMASGVLVPVMAWRQRAELRRLDRREWSLIVLAGTLLASHFATWVPSVKLTSIASATALVATQPIWAALIARRQGQLIPRRAWVGTGVAVVGAALVTGIDFSVSLRAVTGDLLALVAAILAAAYVTAGGEVRRSVTTTTYTALCYSTASVVLLVITVAGRWQLAGYSTNAWVKLVLLTIGAQLLGHSVFNRVLRTTSAMVVSLAILFEVPGAATIAALWLHQYPHIGAVPGLVLLVAGIALVITGGHGVPQPAAVPAE